MSIRNESVNCCRRSNWQPIDKDSKKYVLNALDFDSLLFSFLFLFVFAIVCKMYKYNNLYYIQGQSTFWWVCTWNCLQKNVFDRNMRWSCFDSLRISPSFGLVMICVFFFRFPFCLSFVVDTFRLNAITVWAKRMIHMARGPVKWIP